MQINSREKKLVVLAGGIILIFVALFGFKLLVLNPIHKLDREVLAKQDQLRKAHATRRTHFKNEAILKALTGRTFSDQLDLASAKSGAMLTREILHCGLSEADFTRLPVAPRAIGRRKTRSAQEIGWSIQGSGPLNKIISLLYVLEKSPFLSRLDNLTLSPVGDQDDVKIRFNFLTLVIDTALEVDFKEPRSKPDLNSPERKQYDVIVQRNILRPYIEPPPPPPPPPTPPPSKQPDPTPSPPGPETFRIVSLSEWQGQPEIHVRDLTQNKTLRYKPGDQLAGGVVTMVDYRPLPKPGQDDLKSFSRVIVKIGSEYWAIERGQTLADKYQLAPDQLPPDLPES